MVNLFLNSLSNPFISAMAINSTVTPKEIPIKARSADKNINGWSLSNRKNLFTKYETIDVFKKQIYLFLDHFYHNIVYIFFHYHMGKGHFLLFFY